jgi:hypothetical protein
LTIYRYPTSLVLDEITVRKTEGGAVRAYLHARPTVTAEQLKDIQCGLNAQGLQTVPIVFKGQPSLEVRGFKDELQLTKICADARWISGAREKVVEKEDYISPVDKFHKHTLQAAAASFIVGDIAFMRYGYKGASPLDIAAGAAYTTGTLSSLIFGRKDPSDLHIKDISNRMASFMREHQVAMDANTPLQNITGGHPKGIVERADDFLRHYPAEMMNMFYALAGLSIALASHRKLSKPTDVQTFINNAERYSNAMTGQVEQLQKLLPEAKGELHTLLTNGLNKLKGGQWLHPHDVTAIEHHTGELETLQKLTRMLNSNVPVLDTSKAVRSFSEELEEIAKKEKSVSPKMAIHQQHIEDLKRGNPVHRLALAETDKHHHRESYMDIGLGLTTLASGLFGMFVKEKAIDPDKPKQGVAAHTWDWVQAHPLSVTAAGYMVSTMCHAVSTAIAHVNGNSERRKTVGWRAIFVGTNVLAEILMSISSKGHGKGVKSDFSVDDTVLALSAETIARQPQAMQAGLIDYVGKFLGRDDVLAMNDESIKTRLQHAVEEMRGNPWAVALRPLEKTMPQPEEQAPALPAWQAKLAAQQQAAAMQAPAQPH